jgi:hypothetical protein
MTSHRTSADIIAHIADIYEELEVLPNIREHQARVAGIILVCKAHWRGPAVNWDDAVAAALIHDLGNLIKANLDTPLGQEILGPIECERIEYWKETKRQMITKYGDEYTATRALAERIGASRQVIAIFTTASFSHGIAIIENNDWETKLVAYADRVVGPFGVLTLDERMQEANRRYGYTKHPSDARPPILQAAYDLQVQMQSAVSVPLDSITENAVEPHVQRFLRRD